MAALSVPWLCALALCSLLRPRGLLGTGISINKHEHYDRETPSISLVVKACSYPRTAANTRPCKVGQFHFRIGHRSRKRPSLGSIPLIAT